MMISKYILRFSFLLLAFPVFSFSCGERQKVLDLKVFRITVPKDWIYKKQKGIDSFVGEISTGNSSLSFDYSTMGYASFGPESEQESREIGYPVIPDEAKLHHFSIDTSEKFISKTVWPKTTGKGTTGIYIKSRISSLSFNLDGSNLSQKDQNEALRAFKTLIITPQKN